MATTKWRCFARNLVSATSLSKCVKRMLGKLIPVKFCAFFEKMSPPFCHFISMLSKRTFKVADFYTNTRNVRGGVKNIQILDVLYSVVLGH